MIRPRPAARGVELFPARTPTLPPATHTNSYAIGDREVLLVEPATPYDDERRAWLDWARSLASQGRALQGIIITHHHADHAGGAAFFAKELGLPLLAHEATAKRLHGDARVTQHLSEGDVLSLGGPSPQRWTVLHTPGHAPGHVVLHEEAQGTLIVGDMVASEGTILIAPNDDGDMAEYLRQLDRLASFDALVALPAHGDPIAEASFGVSPTTLFRKYIQHRLGREAKVVDALPREGPGKPISDILPLAYADTPMMLWPIALMSLEAHLIKLEKDGRAERGPAGFRLKAV